MSHSITIARDELLSLEEYALRRQDIRTQMIKRKRRRRLSIGPNVTMLFENRDTIVYQIQEILRAEKIFELDGVEEEIEGYQQLVPQGREWVFVMLVEFPDVEERRRRLAELGGLESTLRLRVGGQEVTPLMNEDMDRTTDEGKTSAVHFGRFPLPDELAKAAKEGATLEFYCTHEKYTYSSQAVSADMQKELAADLA